eukprot:Blabericola_migrator_1__7928@NODE_4062_length_1353_cov_55_405910_g2508_i0_p2_GENE_NODE_4062_length_1353_cov_55_405910_g2508_i0NODE_4062_length_1353_cov_55_405910_g2508_i0_p2_ORF_typecomplete_len111_score19_99Ish1/PF10281_9/0_11_NODE_4062_length_1353_cov_55_405910_g2508_i0175507
MKFVSLMCALLPTTCGGMCWWWDGADCFYRAQPNSQVKCYTSRETCCNRLPVTLKMQCNIRLYNDRGWDTSDLRLEVDQYLITQGIPYYILKALVDLDWNAYSDEGRWPY